MLVVAQMDIDPRQAIAIPRQSAQDSCLHAVNDSHVSLGVVIGMNEDIHDRAAA